MALLWPDDGPGGSSFHIFQPRSRSLLLPLQEKGDKGVTPDLGPWFRENSEDIATLG